MPPKSSKPLTIFPNPQDLPRILTADLGPKQLERGELPGHVAGLAEHVHGQPQAALGFGPRALAGELGLHPPDGSLNDLLLRLANQFVFTHGPGSMRTGWRRAWPRTPRGTSPFSTN